MLRRQLISTHTERWSAALRNIQVDRYFPLRDTDIDTKNAPESLIKVHTFLCGRVRLSRLFVSGKNPRFISLFFLEAASNAFFKFIAQALRAVR